MDEEEVNGYAAELRRTGLDVEVGKYEPVPGGRMDWIIRITRGDRYVALCINGRDCDMFIRGWNERGEK